MIKFTAEESEGIVLFYPVFCPLHNCYIRFTFPNMSAYFRFGIRASTSHEIHRIQATHFRIMIILRAIRIHIFEHLSIQVSYPGCSSHLQYLSPYIPYLCQQHPPNRYRHYTSQQQQRKILIQINTRKYLTPLGIPRGVRY